MDGGYYSEYLFGILIDRKINYIFRTPVSNLYVKNYISDNNTFDICSNNGDKNKCKIVKYIKNNEERYLLTNLINYSSKTINNNYIDRWDVETDFRKLKYDILYNNIRSKTKQQVMIDIKILNFNAILLGYIEYICKEKEGCKINSKNTVELFYTRILEKFLYKNMTKENLAEIYFIFEIVATTVELIRKNRHFKRRRIKPCTKWGKNGNKYENG